jgi:hypothetical protein
MMYSNKLVCSIKAGRKILREKVENNESTVFIPFGSEYSLLLKNLGGRNAVVNIEIDGRKVSQNGFYIRESQTAEIERFVESLTEGRRFRFIEKTEEISDFRGDRVDDGIIRVTWQFEKPLPEVKEIQYKYDHYYSSHKFGCRCPWCCPSIPPIWYGPTTYTKSASDVTYGGAINNSSSIASASLLRSAEPSASFIGFAQGVSNCNVGASAPGITVEGSKSNQSFGTAHAGALETNVHSMVILLRGVTAEKTYIQAPITVEYKKQCSSCGRRWKNMAFCPKCGTALK